MKNTFIAVHKLKDVLFTEFRRKMTIPSVNMVDLNKT